ncbi:MAG: 50S ribosomal protein L5 [Candidatus Micrarchaeota archaeon]|nr:50S ribosomal protein L5 [Candidatus Micrarchaeota archaeon]
MNPMREIKIEKVTLNIGVGQPGERLENAKKLLERITGKKATFTQAKVRNPTFKIRPGLPIGVKVTLRGKDAEEILRKAFKSVKNKISKKSFDEAGNFSIGIKEYIDFPGAKYDPEIGMFGFDVVVTLERPGYRVKKRKRAPSKVGKHHRIKPEEAMEYIKQKFGVEVV